MIPPNTPSTRLLDVALPRTPSQDPFREIVAEPPRTIRSANYWSRRPVTRLDVTLGMYDELSSAEVPDVTDLLVAAMPGLMEHECSVGARGGFVHRLHRGTYAAHIIEHVALEIQMMSGMAVGFGRTRGTGNPSEYTVVFEHTHDEVGRQAALAAVEIVQQAFAGVLRDVSPVITALRVVADTPNTPIPRRHIICGVTGHHGRSAFHTAMRETLTWLGVSPRATDLHDHAMIEDASPSYILESGLPYTHADVAVILDAAPTDVPPLYREPERAARLVSVVAEAVPHGGPVICPADATLVHEMVRRAGRSVVPFEPHTELDVHAHRAAACAATIVRERIQAQTPHASVPRDTRAPSRS